MRLILIPDAFNVLDLFKVLRCSVDAFFQCETSISTFHRSNVDGKHLMRFQRRREAITEPDA